MNLPPFWLLFSRVTESLLDLIVQSFPIHNDFVQDQVPPTNLPLHFLQELSSFGVNGIYDLVYDYIFFNLVRCRLVHISSFFYLISKQTVASMFIWTRPSAQ